MTARQVAQLQRVAGNRATSRLVMRQADDDLTTDAGSVAPTTVQRGRKGEPLPGRATRRRMAEQDELDAMDKANAEWESSRTGQTVDPSSNPFSVLAGLEPEQAEAPKPVAKPVAIPKPDLAMLRAAGDDLAALKGVLAGHYPDAVAAQMVRSWRSGRVFRDIDALRSVAEKKLAERDDGGGSTYSPGVLLNARPGRPESNLKKGRGEGYLAGQGGRWHVHYDHVKYGSNAATRVNFPGRTRQKILDDLAVAAQRVSDTTDLQACRQWIIANIR